MIEYQNIFIQVQDPPKWEVDDNRQISRERIFRPGFSKLAGWLDNAQLVPFYLGWTGIVSLFCDCLWLNIIGINMLAQVNWSLSEFLRRGFWLALEPPSPEYGLTIPPLNDDSWYIVASFFLLVSVCA